MARLSRNSSRGDLIQWEEFAGFLGPAIKGAACTCGAGEALEAERRRLRARGQQLAERSEHLLELEAELDERAQGLEAASQALQRRERELRQRRAAARVQLAEADRLLCDVARREEAVKQWEEELHQQAAQLNLLQAEADQCEEAAGADELALLEERALVEEELVQVERELAALSSEATDRDHAWNICRKQMQEAEDELKAVEADEVLLTEIEAQVDPIRQHLSDRERRLATEETDMCAREADCDEREACLVPEYEHSVESLAVAEQRLCYLGEREADTLRHKQRLLQRQREMGGTEIRLCGLEGALQRQGTGATVAPELAQPLDIEEMRARLTQLRRADAEWSGRVQAQQLEVQRLEALGEQATSRTSGLGTPGP